MAHVEAVHADADPFIIVFTHGWKHSAADDDANVVAVRRLLHAAAHTEQLRPADGRARRIVGLYIGWRGLTLHWLGLLETVTFWGRKGAALRVALGSVREVFARLRRFRVDAGLQRKGSGTRLVLVGHSFGGLIVHAAVAEYLVESVAAPGTDPVAPFGDLTVLVNPAFEAARYHPLHSVVARRRFAPRQPPVFISLTASNDAATGAAFPIGRLLDPWRGPSIGKREHDATLDTMGHVLWMQTHEITLGKARLPAGIPPDHKTHLDDAERQRVLDQEDADFRAFVRDKADADGHLLPGWSRQYTWGALLREVRPQPGEDETGIVPDNPFWVVRAAPEIIDGHGGIFGDAFLDFLRQVIDDVMRASQPDLAR